MTEAVEELATMKDVHVGHRDAPWPCLWFTVEMMHGAALQILRLEDPETIKLIGSVYDIERLEKHPCIVTVDNGLVKFKELKK